jgi:hypothetical protein
MGAKERVDITDKGTPVVSIVIQCDYNITLNQMMKNMNHPLPRIDKIFDKLKNVREKDSKM